METTNKELELWFIEFADVKVGEWFIHSLSIGMSKVDHSHDVEPFPRNAKWLGMDNTSLPRQTNPEYKLKFHTWDKAIRLLRNIKRLDTVPFVGRRELVYRLHNRYTDAVILADLLV